MNRSKQGYSQLRKPSFAPPPWIFGPVWTVLYILIAMSFGYVGYEVWQGELPPVLFIPFAINLISNFLFTPIMFWMRSLALAALDILIVLASLVIALIHIYPYAPWVAYVNIPYLLWVSFASLLQLTITCMNRNKLWVY